VSVILRSPVSWAAFRGKAHHRPQVMITASVPGLRNSAPRMG